MQITRVIVAATAAFTALQGSAAAQATFTGSIGDVFGGDAPSTKRAWAIAIGGGGAHGIGSDSSSRRRGISSRHRTASRTGKFFTLMPSILVTVPTFQSAAVQHIWIRVHQAAAGDIGRGNFFQPVRR